MSGSEQQVRLAARLYEMRDTAKRFSGDRWPKTFATFGGYVQAAMKKWNLDTIPAAMRLVGELQKNAPGSEMTQMYLVAAAVELIEPEKTKS